MVSLGFVPCQPLPSPLPWLLPLQDKRRGKKTPQPDSAEFASALVNQVGSGVLLCKSDWTIQYMSHDKAGTY